MKATVKQFTVRLPGDLYARSVRMAKRHRLSLNELARRGLQQLTAQEANAELKAGFDLLGTDREESNVEHFLPAFEEVIRDDR